MDNVTERAMLPEDMNNLISRLRANGSALAMDQAHMIERDHENIGADYTTPPAETQNPAVIQTPPAALAPQGPVHVEGTPVDTPEPPPLPTNPVPAAAPPTAEERLSTTEVPPAPEFGADTPPDNTEPTVGS